MEANARDATLGAWQQDQLSLGARRVSFSSTWLITGQRPASRPETAQRLVQSIRRRTFHPYLISSRHRALTRVTQPTTRTGTPGTRQFAQSAYPTWRSSSAGFYVLVQPQCIRGVVLSFDSRETGIVRSVCSPDQLITRFAQLVHVRAKCEGLQGVAQSVDRLHRLHRGSKHSKEDGLGRRWTIRLQIHPASAVPVRAAHRRGPTRGVRARATGGRFVRAICRRIRDARLVPGK